MGNILKVTVAIPGVLFVVLGLRWLVDPAGMADELGMPLLDGLGRSTQIGDLGAFFLVGGAMMLLGIITQRREWFTAPAMLLGCTAVFRILAWLVHDAALAVPQIAIEVVVAVLLLFAASRAGQHVSR